MIKLTRLNGQTITINIDLVKYIEANPDTRVVFLNNDLLIVKEKMDEVIDKAVKYKQEIFRQFTTTTTQAQTQTQT
ncbi:MAG: flagellar FlbD family protein [Oligoflexia bacterium]|nr:flagellar FlbD family protein [Oligoflexia bacterium]